MIYLDYSASTPVDPRVLDAMLPYFGQHFGNASSRLHAHGWLAEDAVSEARQQIAQITDCQKNEIYFTSGSTEGINLILRGVTRGARNKILTLRTEHRAVLDTCVSLEKKGYEIQFVEIDAFGSIDLKDLENKIDEQCLMVSIMAVNNETGLIQDMEAIGKACKKKDCILFCDATQGIGKMPFSFHELGIDAAVFSAHKFYGPKGIGAAFISNKIKPIIEPLISGGGQERNLRSGTLNVPGIIGMAKAIEIVNHDLAKEHSRIKQLQYLLLEKINKVEKVAIKLNTDLARSVPHILNIEFAGIDSESLMNKCGHELCLSNGSACNAAKSSPSPVLLALGKSEAEANTALRFSIGRFTTEEEILQAVAILSSALKKA